MSRAAARGLVVMLALALAGCLADLSAFDRGMLAFQQARYREAVDAFSDFLRIAPESVAALNNRAVARIRLGDARGAIEDYTRAIELSPNDPEIYYNRGDARIAAGDPEGGIDDFPRAIVLRPSFARAHFNRGSALLVVGDVQGARADFAAAIEAELDPRIKAEMQRAADPELPAPRAFPSASPPVPASATVTAQQLDARALATRGLGRELDGDRAGAIQDLRSALALETSPSRRAAIERLLRVFETSR
jgi:tetratricopeptide (TPR) repeat protein